MSKEPHISGSWKKYNLPRYSVFLLIMHELGISSSKPTFQGMTPLGVVFFLIVLVTFRWRGIHPSFASEIRWTTKNLGDGWTPIKKMGCLPSGMFTSLPSIYHLHNGWTPTNIMGCFTSTRNIMGCFTSTSDLDFAGPSTISMFPLLFFFSEGKFECHR